MYEKHCSTMGYDYREPKHYRQIALSDELIEVDASIEEAQSLMVEGRILDVSNGEACRRFQQARIPLARPVD